MASFHTCGLWTSKTPAQYPRTASRYNWSTWRYTSVTTDHFYAPSEINQHRKVRKKSHRETYPETSHDESKLDSANTQVLKPTWKYTPHTHWDHAQRHIKSTIYIHSAQTAHIRKSIMACTYKSITDTYSYTHTPMWRTVTATQHTTCPRPGKPLQSPQVLLTPVWEYPGSGLAGAGAEGEAVLGAAVDGQVAVDAVVIAAGLEGAGGTHLWPVHPGRRLTLHTHL